MSEKFESGYSHKDTESRVYKAWEESGYFNPDVCIEKGVTDEDAEVFSMVLPPLNVTGIMHVGHASMTAIEDTFTRYYRMRGRRTLWIPGTDHAAIATQSKVEKLLAKEGVKRTDLGREKFLDRVEAFAQNSHDTIISQLKKLGASLDWSREAFTLDEIREEAVFTAFKRMYEKEIIYRGDRVVNWDPKGQTTVSDDEVVHEESKGMLYTFTYSKDFPIPVATTRLETKLGDTAVAVHPEDDRYKEYIGRTFDLEFMGVELSIKVVGDEEVDPEYGTGAVGVTPAHSMTDWRIAERHNLPLKKVINEYAKMENTSDILDGLKTKEAREKVRDWLKEHDLLIGEEEVEVNISRAERTNGIIEPLPKLQWFIDVNKEFIIEHSSIEGIADGDTVTLKKLMRTPVEKGQVRIFPERLKKVYFHWIDKLYDWNISRQIWYGHRIPMWYKDGEIKVSKGSPGDGWVQDEDTLDTWFSSGLWSFSTLGWPKDTEDLKRYHPNTLLETGYDILFFWIARMMLMTTYLLGDVPFQNVYMHGLVRDKHGRKISKSLGNNIDPVDVVEESGADALRLAMLVGASPGSDNNLDLNDVRGYRKFANKLWNIARFIFMNLEDGYEHVDTPVLTDKERDLLKEGEDIAREITGYIENYQLHLAAEKIYHYVWHRFADEIVENSKEDLQKGDEAAQRRARFVLVELFSMSLKLLHPFMPFVTEEIWTHMPSKKRDFLMVEKWPILGSSS